jgi:hypothetical protein
MHESGARKSRGVDALKLPLAASAVRVRHAGRLLPALVLAVAVLTCALAWADPGRRALWLALLSGTIGAATYLGLAWLRRREATVPRAWLVVDDEEIMRVQAGPRGETRKRTSLARWDSPFGLSVLANASRSQVLLAFTTPSATRFLGLSIDTPRDADTARDVLDRAITVGDIDIELAAGAGADVQLTAAAARALLSELDVRDESALSRLYLSDARGTPISIEREHLVIGERSIDLAAPVDWRVFTFQEGDRYQATSIRQGSHEVVLVCRAGADVAAWSSGGADAPPRESRVAIDGLFMTPIRAMLAQAPRVSRPGPPPERRRGRSVVT